MKFVKNRFTFFIKNFTHRKLASLGITHAKFDLNQFIYLFAVCTNLQTNKQNIFSQKHYFESRGPKMYF